MTGSRLLADTATLSNGLGYDLVIAIRRLILSGELAAGDRLLPQSLQDRFGVSVIPVREALRTLEAEGLVTTTPRRGTTVNSLSLTELADVYQLRRLVEPTLAAAATERRTDADLHRARTAFDLMERIDGRNTQDWMNAHRDFHWSLMDVEIGPASARIVRQLWAISERYVAMSLAAFRVDRPARHDHQKLLSAFELRDPIGMAREWESHLHLVEKTVIQDFESQGS